MAPMAGTGEMEEMVRRAGLVETVEMELRADLAEMEEMGGMDHRGRRGQKDRGVRSGQLGRKVT
jgi:hypothetical protein